MPIDDVAVSRSIIESYTKKLLAGLQVDVALVGAGPANMVAGYVVDGTASESSPKGA